MLPAITEPPLEAYANATYAQLLRLSTALFTEVYHHQTPLLTNLGHIGSSVSTLLNYHDNPHLIRDAFAAVVTCALLITLARHLVISLVVNFLLRRRYLRHRNVARFSESLYSFVYYSVSFTLAARIQHRSGFLQHPERLWADFSLSKPIPTDMHVLYLVESSHYLHCLFTLVITPTLNRSDAAIMFGHHCIALLLISISFLTKTVRLGVLLLYLLNICDVLMEGGKLLLRLQFHDGFTRTVVEAVKVCQFGALLVTWAAFRLHHYPLRVIYPAALYLTYNRIDDWLPFTFPLFVLLWLVLALSVYWGGLLVKVLVNTLMGGQIEDIREVEEEEEDGDEGEEETKKKKKKAVQSGVIRSDESEQLKKEKNGDNKKLN